MVISSLVSNLLHMRFILIRVGAREKIMSKGYILFIGKDKQFFLFLRRSYGRNIQFYYDGKNAVLCVINNRQKKYKRVGKSVIYTFGRFVYNVSTQFAKSKRKSFSIKLLINQLPTSDFTSVCSFVIFQPRAADKSFEHGPIKQYLYFRAFELLI